MNYTFTRSRNKTHPGSKMIIHFVDENDYAKYTAELDKAKMRLPKECSEIMESVVTEIKRRFHTYPNSNEYGSSFLYPRECETFLQLMYAVLLTVDPSSKNVTE